MSRKFIEYDAIANKLSRDILSHFNYIEVIPVNYIYKWNALVGNHDKNIYQMVEEWEDSQERCDIYYKKENG